jgi:hypothetical protein
VYFKSGSLYSCKPEPGFACGKYKGNVRNFMNSTAIVEVSERTPPLHYIAVVLSNVLRRNSAVEHQTLGTRIHRLVIAPPGAGGAAPAVTTPVEDQPIGSTMISRLGLAARAVGDATAMGMAVPTITLSLWNVPGARLAKARRRDSACARTNLCSIAGSARMRFISRLYSGVTRFPVWSR